MNDRGYPNSVSLLMLQVFYNKKLQIYNTAFDTTLDLNLQRELDLKISNAIDLSD